MILKHTLGEALELQLPQSEAPLWRYVYGGKPKPFFHPLHTPGGQCVSLFEPHDHIWHRGLWFTIKYINGENFWEENGDFGTQQTVLPPSIAHRSDGTLAWTSEILWQRPHNAGVVFEERRELSFRLIEPEAYILDWNTELTAQADLLLDRTPFNAWGGYSGLILRGNRNWQKTQLLFPDNSTSERPIGIPAQWCDLSGVFDGGSGLTGGVAMFDCPTNLRSPSPWYGATGSGHYFNAAFLFHEPLNVAARQTLKFRYRVLVHDGLWDASRLQAAYDSYTQESHNE